MTKILDKLGIEGTYVDVIKAMGDKPRANIIFNDERWKLFLQDREQDKVPTLCIPLQCSAGGPSQGNQERKGIRIENEEVKLSLFSDYIILYIESYRLHQNLDLSNEFGKVVRYKANIQNSIMFVYINNELSERNKMILFTIA